MQEWQLSLALLVGLTAAKASVVTALAPLFDLNLSQSVRLGFLLASGSGEACVIYGLAGQYQVIDDATLKLLTTIVVVSSALTPLFDAIGENLSNSLETKADDAGNETTLLDDVPAPEPEQSRLVLICGMGPLGQQVASLIANLEVAGKGVQWIGLDLDPQRVKQLRDRQQPVYYGDASRLQVLTTAGLVSAPEVIVVTYVDPDQVEVTIERLRSCFPSVPILSHTSNAGSYAKLLQAVNTAEGVSNQAPTPVVSGVTETALRLGSKAISAVASVPVDVRNEWSQYLRRETELRLANPSPDASVSEVDTFFVGAAPEACLSVWDVVEPTNSVGEQTARSLRYLEAVALLQDQVLSGSALASLAADIRGAAQGPASVAADLPRRSFQAGQAIFREGEEGNEMFIVEQGSCMACIADEVVAEYAAGDNFGEYAIVLKQPRPVTIIAKTDVSVVVIDLVAFDRLTQSV